jgi:hypothetical protein
MFARNFLSLIEVETSDEELECLFIFSCFPRNKLLGNYGLILGEGGG